MNQVIELLQKTIQQWQEDRVPSHAAALAYYTIFSLAPFLLIAVVVAGSIVGQADVQNEIVQQIEESVGPDTANFLDSVLERTEEQRSAGGLAAVVGVIFLFVSATTIYRQLKQSINVIWDVEEPDTTGLMDFVINQLMAVLLVIGAGLLLIMVMLLSTIVSAILGAAPAAITGTLPILQMVNYLLAFVVVTFTIAILFKVPPDVQLAWKDVLVGAVVTALLFMIGQVAINIYIQNSGIASVYGAAGSLIVILLWIYFSANIFFIGAEFTQVYSRMFGSESI